MKVILTELTAFRNVEIKLPNICPKIFQNPIEMVQISNIFSIVSGFIRVEIIHFRIKIETMPDGIIMDA